MVINHSSPAPSRAWAAGWWWVSTLIHLHLHAGQSSRILIEMDFSHIDLHRWQEMTYCHAGMCCDITIFSFRGPDFLRIVQQKCKCSSCLGSTVWWAHIMWLKIKNKWCYPTFRTWHELVAYVAGKPGEKFCILHIQRIYTATCQTWMVF